MPIKPKETPETREAARLRKDPYPTAVAPDHDETLDHLRGWVPPNGAYVLFEAPVRHTRDEGVFEWGTRLHTMTVEYQPEQKELIQYYLAKGHKILHYANFPKFNDSNQERARRAVMYSQGKGVSPWDELEAFLKVMMRKGNAERDNVKLREEKSALEAKVAEYEAKLAAQRKGGKGQEAPAV
jgi:hypothetical protein